MIDSLRDPVTLVRAAIVAVVAAVLAYTWADPDLWGHVRFGGDIVAAGSIPRADPYSFTSEAGWINHEWLAEVAMYASYALGGDIGLVWLKVLIVLSTLAIVVGTMRRLDVPPAARDVLLVVAVAGANARLLAVRPQLFSVLLFVMTLALLRGIDRGHHRYLVCLPVVMALWVNLHGGWIVGLGTIGLWGFWRVLGPPPGIGRLPLGLALGASVLATLVNPYGVGLWEFLGETVRFGRPDIEEWRPITAFPRLAIPWAIAWLLAAAAAYRSWPTVSYAYLTVVVGLGVASFRVSRLDAFFAFAVVMLLAPEIGRLWSTRSSSSRPQAAPSRAETLVVSTIAWIVIAGAAVATVGNLTWVRMTDDGLPEPEAARFILGNRLQGRMVTWFDWGEYAIWHFAPRITVSIDGRRETIYTNDQIQDHLRFYFNGPGASTFPRTLNADYIWLPKVLPVVASLRTEGWHELYIGERSVLLARDPQPAHALVPVLARAAEPAARRSFPGP